MQNFTALIPYSKHFFVTHTFLKRFGDPGEFLEYFSRIPHTFSYRIST